MVSVAKENREKFYESIRKRFDNNEHKLKLLVKENKFLDEGMVLGNKVKASTLLEMTQSQSLVD